jgi:hypothetical protein
MPLAIFVDKKEEISRPVFICDYCKEIVDTYNGSCIWYETRNEDEITDI